MRTPEPITDRDETLAFIAAMQASPKTACGYVGDIDDGLELDLDELDQPWTETARVLRDADGRITGAALVEWDEETGRAWVYGPWATPETWEADGPVLLAAITEQTPVDDHEIYGPLVNEHLARLAEQVGWAAGEANYVFTHERAGLAKPDDRVRQATAEDLPGVRRLHDHAFPGTYATAAALLGAEYTTLVAVVDGAVVGYAAGHADGEDAYLDFVAVEPAARRQGLGTALIGAFADALLGADVILTVDERATEARALYAAQGWRLAQPTRGYRSPGSRASSE